MVSIFKMCRKYLIKNKYCVIWYGFLCLTSSIFSMISPYISGNFIDYLIVADDISKIYQYCFVFFGLFVINQLIGYIVNRVYIKMQTQIRFDLESFYGGLHCGECFDVKVKNVWVPVRIEMGDDWYLVGLNVSRLDGLRVRM